MPSFNAPTNGGTVSASNGNDVVTGSAVDDILRGLGGNDLINGADGNDTIFGDGLISYAAAFNTVGYATLAYAGTATPTGNGLSFASLGNTGTQSVWQIRNSSTVDRVVTLKSASQGVGNNGAFSYTVIIPALSDVVLPSNNLGSHKLFLDGKQLDTKAAGTQVFNATAMVATSDGNDTINGGNGNDTLDGGGGSDIVHGNNGDDTITGGKGDDSLFGDAGDDTFLADVSSTGDKYDGGVGIDTFKIDGTSVQGVGQLIDLVAGPNSRGDTFISIENIIGGTSDDTFRGTDDANSLWGNAGNDVLEGRGGNDSLFGGLGNDTLSGSDGDDALDGGAGDDVLDGGTGNDRLVASIGNDKLSGGDGADALFAGEGNDSVDGGAGNDVLYGDAGNDTLTGGLGHDRITGGAGADAINGNDGVDTADYRHSAVGVDVSLMRGTGLLGDAEGDTLQFVENLSGSAFADVLTGDNGANRITGMSGEDKIYGMGGNDYIATGGGYDYVDGGDGVDTVTYEDSWDHVVVNLTTGKNQYGEASRDVLINVENIVGSVYNDTITGDAAANRLTGGEGADVLNGMAGIDYLYGEDGNDSLTGGSEADVFVFELGFGDDTVTDFWAGAGRTDRMWFQSNGTLSPASASWHAADTAAGAVITVDGQGSVTLLGVHLAQLHTDDFIFT